MWKPEHRLTTDRRSLRYPSDLSDAEWALVAPMIPPARRGGRRRSVDVREVLNAIFYVLSTGCQWKAMPKDLPPKSTAHCYFMLWDWDGTHWIVFMMHFMSQHAKPPDERQVRQLQSSTPKAARQRKKGVCTRPAGL